MSIRHLVLASLLAASAVIAPAIEPGEAAPGFTLTDNAGKTHNLSDFKGKVVVLEWSNPGCPFVVDTFERGVSNAIAKRFEGNENLVYVLVNSTNATHQDHKSGEELTAWYAEHNAKFPVLLDTDGTVGRAYGAKTTPHVFVIDAEGVVRYNGAIDSNPLNRKPEGVQNYAADAIDAVLAGKPVATPKTDSWGCTIKYGPVVSQAAPANVGEAVSVATGSAAAVCPEAEKCAKSAECTEADKCTAAEKAACCPEAKEGKVVAAAPASCCSMPKN